MGFEPTIHLWTSDFESDRWPIRLPSEQASSNVEQLRQTLKFARTTGTGQSMATPEALSGGPHASSDVN